MSGKCGPILELLIGKGRITLWIILLTISALAFTGKVSGDKALAAITALASFALSGELSRRGESE
jgi:hypothetical protein